MTLYDSDSSHFIISSRPRKGEGGREKIEERAVTDWMPPWFMGNPCAKEYTSIANPVICGPSTYSCIFAIFSQHTQAVPSTTFQ